MSFRISSLLVIAVWGFTSCNTTSQLGYLPIEMMIPAQFTLSEGMDTIAIFKRDLFKSDTAIFKYHDLRKHVDVIDTLVNYRDLSNRCVDELAKNLALTGNFLKVANHRDTTMLLENPFNYPELHKKSGADVLVMLDSFYLNDLLINGNIQNLGQEIFTRFPEFRGSNRLECIEPAIIWTVSIKGNPNVYVCQQPEKLFYGNNLYPALFGNAENHRLLLQTAAEYLGKSLTEKLIPSMQQVERTYCHSNNAQMLMAEKYLISGDWLKAAEIYNKATTNKNRNIAAKAKYNMALVCEMEGNIDAAFEWLILPDSNYKKGNPQHEFNCDQYYKLLILRQKELKRIEIQIKHNG